MRENIVWRMLTCAVTVSSFLLCPSSQAFMIPSSPAQMEKSASILAFQGENEAMLKKSFAVFDTNKDGAVSRIEFRLQTGQMFFVSDKNRDSHLTPDELPNTGPKAFAAADSNGDGKLTSHEFGESDLAKFKTYDLNKDNKITIDEVRAVIKKQQP